MSKKKRQGHYCRICGEHKANEKFNGKGHAKHICKACDALPQERKNELQYIIRIEKIADKYPRSKQDWELLEKYSKNTKYPEAMGFAQMILGMSGRYSLEDEDLEEDELEYWEENDDNPFAITILFSEVDEDIKEEISFDIYETVKDFILRYDYIPENKHKQERIDNICIDLSSGYGLIVSEDEELNKLFDQIQANVIDDFREEGIMVQTYSASLVVMETGRLKIRKFTRDDLTNLHAIMQKPEVMYAWEHGFTKSETRKWLNRNLTRYKKDGYSYFAVTLKETEQLIGVVGIFKSVILEKEVVELGYILDNLYWNQGYCAEAANACVQFAFDKLKLDELYCSIRPNNISSIHIAEKLGMKIVGEHIVNYRKQEMPHTVYVLRNLPKEDTNSSKYN